MLRLPPRPSSVGFIAPCQPANTIRPPAGPGWVHEIKHDGYRLMARRDSAGIRLITRNGHDWAERFPAVIKAVNVLKARSCLIDGEAVICDAAGLASFALLRRGDRVKPHAHLFAFDLLELDGEDLRRRALEERKRMLADLVRAALPGLQLVEHLAHAGDVVYAHACALGCEGIVSKRLGSRYVSGRSSDWLKSKNPASPAVQRETEEDWTRPRGRGR